MIHKLQQAINGNGGRLLLDRAQFFSEELKRPITMYRLCEVTYDENNEPKKNCIFSTASQLQIVLFLRDYWFIMQGKEIPLQNNQTWADIRKEKQLNYSGAHRLHEELMKRREHADI